MQKWISGIVYAGFCLVIGLEILLLTAVGAYLFDILVPELLAIAGSFFAAGILLLLGRRIGLKRIVFLSVLAMVTLTALVVGMYTGWVVFSERGMYRDAARDKQQLFAGRKVLAIVPHQDDELNILGGVLEEYVAYGSEVYVVYVTNGDYDGIPQIRFQEALQVADGVGLDREHLIFLGYGDQWEEGSEHIYNAPAGKQLISHYGKSETYGMEFHPPYREGRAYTSENLQEDLMAVILEYRPDVIFCSDYDTHVDHRATTLLFEKVMGRILKAEPAYRPAVYKGYAYYTAWIGPEDYYGENVRSSICNYADYGGPDAQVYRWSERVRFPVSTSVLSRSLITSAGYSRLLEYDSQEAYIRAERILNGDKVFWERRTDSLCIAAELTATSAQADLLNDFMLLENQNLLDRARMPWDGVWIPEAADPEKAVTVSFAQPVDVRDVVLYDHPSPGQNVTAAQILFDDGTVLEAGPLEINGAGTMIRADKTAVSSFTVRILATEGTEAGLSEIEAFSGPVTEHGKYIKLMDPQEDFAYDYWTKRDGNARFTLCTYGCQIGSESSDVVLTLSNPECLAEYQNGTILVQCPAGEETVLTVATASGELSDSIWIRNPVDSWRKVTEFYQHLENKQHEDRCMGTFYRLLQNPAAKWIIDKTHLATRSYIRAKQ